MTKPTIIRWLFILLGCVLLTGKGGTATATTDIFDYLYTPQKTEKKISMDFKNAQLSDVLKIFSQQSGLNFIASTDIANKKINLYLDQVPVEEALERILSANNLTYELDPGSNIFVVKELAQPDKNLITRVYHLRFATVPSSKLNKTISISSSKTSGSSDSSSSDSSSSSSSSSDSSSSSSSSEEGSLLTILQSILTSNGSINEDIRTNSLIITDIPSQFPIIEQTIARLDIRIPSILIEVEMLDVSKNTSDLLGAKWGDTPGSFQGGERDDLYPFDKYESEGYFTEPTEQYRVSTLAFRGLSFVLNLLKTQTDTRNLARPRILTLNNETAEINIKTDEAIGVNTVTESSQGSATATAEAERTETGVFLKVTPQANVDTSEITMAIQPRVIQAKTGLTFNTGSGTVQFKDPEERVTKSILRIRDGDTIMIGGLLRTDLTDIRTNVPLISKIPLVGAAFRHKDKKDSDRELVIFISPHILREEFNPTVTARNDPLMREQDAPERSAEVNKALTVTERKRL